jgi:hypothetical protein
VVIARRDPPPREPAALREASVPREATA